MLVIQRKRNESFWIGNNVEVKILAVRDGSIRIGIAAPKELCILRDEIRVLGDGRTEGILAKSNPRVGV